MVKKKSKKHAANKFRRMDPVQKTTLVIENVDELKYAKVTKKLGNGRYTLVTPDNKQYLGKIRGAIRKFTHLEIGDVVMMSLREFDDNKVDICHKYSFDDVKFLERKGHLIWTTDTKHATAMGIVFEDPSDEKELDAAQEEIDINEIY